MCGRYAITYTWDELCALMDAMGGEPCAVPRFNIAPSQAAPILRRDHKGERVLGAMRWGLVPGWAKAPSVGNRMVNARVETLSRAPAFRGAFRSRRCVIPASGFFEWQSTGESADRSGARQPWYLSREDGGMLFLAGLWERWESAGVSPVETFTIITTPARSPASEIHHRMPLVLSAEDTERWLHPESVIDPAAVAAIQARRVELRMHRVGRAVNSPKVDRPELIAPDVVGIEDRRPERPLADPREGTLWA